MGGPEAKDADADDLDDGLESKKGKTRIGRVIMACHPLAGGGG